MSYEEEKQDRRIEQLEAEIERLRAELARVNQAREAEIDQAGAAERIYLEGVRAKDARIKELEDALVERAAIVDFLQEAWGSTIQLRAAKAQMREWDRLPENFKESWRKGVRKRLQAEGKIGPDTKQHDHTAEFFRPNESPAKSWRITDERRRALSEATTFLPEGYGGDTARIRNVLRGMLEEAGQK